VHTSTLAGKVLQVPAMPMRSSQQCSPFLGGSLGAPQQQQQGHQELI
jgi:hypothetical protein